MKERSRPVHWFTGRDNEILRVVLAALQNTRQLDCPLLSVEVRPAHGNFIDIYRNISVYKTK